MGKLSRLLPPKNGGMWKMIELPKEEYTHAKENGKLVTYCTLRQKAMHVIGLDGYRKPYTRHGKRFYKPYRNYFDAPKAGDRDLIGWWKLGSWNGRLPI